MSDIQKEFKDYALSKGWCIDGESTQNGYLFYNTQTNDRWIGWQAAKSKAVPEGFVLVPHDVAERCMGHISIAMCHPNNSNAENDVMQMDLDILESKVEAQEKSHD